MTDEQIIEALATKVMGWRQVKFPAMVTESADDGIVRFIVNSAGEIETRRRRDGAWGNWEYFRPLTNPADSKMVREKLAEQGYRRQELKRSWIEPTVYSFEIERREPRHASGYEVTTGPHADTEERAVALCALKAVGVEV